MTKQDTHNTLSAKDDTGLIVPPEGGILRTCVDGVYLLRADFEHRLGMIKSAARKLASSIDWNGWQPNRPTVLCFSRATFNKDVDEMRRRTKLNLVGIKTTAIKRAQERWVPPAWRIQTYFTDLLNQELISFRPFLVTFARELLLAASETHPIDAMLAANSDYWQDESLRLAGKELGIPFVTLCRENYTIPVDQRTVLTRFLAGRFRYTGAAIAVYSAPTKEVLERSGGFLPEAVEVTGAPRFDRWRDIGSLPLSDRYCITLISFASPLYYAPEAFKEAAQAIGDALAETKSRLRVVVKMKKENEAESNRAAAPALARQSAEFVADWSLYDLLPKSRAVIGYNSMAVAEGLLADVPVIIPYWGDAVQRTRSMFSPEGELDRKCIYFPENPNELHGLIIKAVTVGLPALGSIAERRECFSNVVVAPLHGTSSELVEALIRRHLPLRQRSDSDIARRQ